MSGTGTGQVLAGRYRLLDQVAVGAMGEVWRAHDDRLDRDVAVKVLRPELADDDGFLDRFRTEARHAASVRHPHVAAVHDYGEDPAVRTGGSATAYLVMDLLQGTPLNALLAGSGPLPAARVAALLAQVADALAAAHRIGLVHRDVKPANLVVSGPQDERGGDDVTVTDFGIARAADAVPVTRTGLVMGTAEYLSPEQARGERATTASDVYSLGVVAYELLTGEPPFTADAPADVARAHVHDPVPPLPDSVPAAMRATVVRCLAKNPAARPDVVALATRLRAVADGTADDGTGSTAGRSGGGEASAWGPEPADLVAAAPAAPASAPRPAGPAVPRTREIPVIPVRAGTSGTDPAAATSATSGASGTGTAPATGGTTGAAVRPGAARVTPARSTPSRRRRPLRAPLVALLALVALLLLATLLQALGLLGSGDGSSTAALTHVTGSPWATIDKDGR
ncbi:serine/threonine-protein kinase [Jannaschia sp. R86511]|uniref:serine/threonine-protein kinase n=1 Tax=Jannaschia sp. R86511 TaxID=3093853 RepID=UPI0036D22817